MHHRTLVASAALAACMLWLQAAPARADDSVDRYRAAAKMDAAAAADLERKSQKRPDDWKLHVVLLSYWTRHGSANPAEAKPARARHLLWLIENRPEASILAYPQAATVNLQSHPLADPETFGKARALWLAHLERASMAAVLHAAVFLGPQDPKAAFEVLSRLPEKDRRAQELLGQICASAYVGGLGLDHTTEFALWLDPELPRSTLAAECKQIIEQSEDKDLLRGFVIKAARDGSEFYLDGKLDWDYAKFLQTPAIRTAILDPNHPLVRAIPGLALPNRIEQGPRIVSITGDEMQMRVTKSVPPIYPQAERMQRVTGSARLLVMIDPNGDVVRIDPVAGPPGLQEAAAAAVSQWKYEGVEHLGRPYYVLTFVQVNFTLSPRMSAD